MLFNLLIGFLILCFITFIGIAFIFYKAMKVNQRDQKKTTKSQDK